MDTFFLITVVSEKEERQGSYGPYQSFLEANTVALDSTDLLLRLSKVESREKCLVQIIECTYTNDAVMVVCTRGSIYLNGYRINQED